MRLVRSTRTRRHLIVIKRKARSISPSSTRREVGIPACARSFQDDKIVIITSEYLHAISEFRCVVGFRTNLSTAGSPRFFFSSFCRERIRRNSGESKRAETHYAREKVRDTFAKRSTRRQGAKGRGNAVVVVVVGRERERTRKHAKGVAGFKKREKEQRVGT